MSGLSIDPATLPHGERYKLLTGLVIPRPIAFVTSMSPTGVIWLQARSTDREIGTKVTFFCRLSRTPLSSQAKGGVCSVDTIGIGSASAIVTGR